MIINGLTVSLCFLLLSLDDFNHAKINRSALHKNNVISALEDK